jgi:hypothetical protein
MSRSLDSGPARSEREQAPVRPSNTPRERVEDQRRDTKTLYKFNTNSYRLNANQEAMLRDIGMFRTVTTESLQKHVYRGDKDSMEKDLRNLRDLRLVTTQAGTNGKDRYASLTRTGKRLTETQLRTNNAQALYSGIVKKRELRHDAAIYELYHKEAEKISSSGGRVKRVVLDFELKKNVNRQLARIQILSPADRERERKVIAEQHGLKIVKGKIQLPDLRMEYESREQEECRVDLECVTGHYKARQIAAKKSAGFKLYNQDYRGKAAERGEDLIGEVMSL